MTKKIMFIHGMFLNPKSWRKWQDFFQQRGYETIAPPWPLHDGDPAALRANLPAGIGELSLAEVVASMERAAAPHGDDLILVGHSVGGLLVQILASRGIGSIGVPICSVAPNRMLSLDWGFFRNSAAITNPLKGDQPFPMDADGFHKNFGNTMTREASDIAFEQFGMSESRNVLRDSMGDLGKIDVERPHVPLLFIGAEKDEIVPAHLCERNAKAYTDPTSRADYMMFSGRGHFICGEPRWEEVATYVADWLQQTAPIEVARAAETSHT
jgi:pimeloyl-ACP methyl ester carboxylesterase